MSCQFHPGCSRCQHGIFFMVGLACVGGYKYHGPWRADIAKHGIIFMLVPSSWGSTRFGKPWASASQTHHCGSCTPTTASGTPIGSTWLCRRGQWWPPEWVGGSAGSSFPLQVEREGGKPKSLKADTNVETVVCEWATSVPGEPTVQAQRNTKNYNGHRRKSPKLL